MIASYLGAEVEDAGMFASYWARVKGRVNELLALPAKIRGLRQEALGAKILADAKGARDISRTLSVSSTTLDGMLATANEVVAKIRTWLPHWQKQEAANPLSGLGVLPLLVIAPLAVAALAYVAVKGAGLIKDYALQAQIVAEAKRGLAMGQYSVDEAARLIKGSAPPGDEGFFAKFGEGIAGPVGIGIVAIGGFFLYQRFGKR